jgi:cytochrome c oxidase cbb3-type subunit IV
MDLNFVRGLITLVLFLLFIALCLWAWSGRRRADFDAAARLPFDESDHIVRKNEEKH